MDRVQYAQHLLLSGRSDWKAKKDLDTPQMSCLLPKISVKQWRSENFERGPMISTFVRLSFYSAELLQS